MEQLRHKTGRKIKPLQCVFYISLLVAIIVTSHVKAGQAEDSQLSEGGTLRLKTPCCRWWRSTLKTHLSPWKSAWTSDSMASKK
ncbi:MAG: hypothetical protein ACYSU5_21700 [Planctomycetota bacterium]